MRHSMRNLYDVTDAVFDLLQAIAPLHLHSASSILLDAWKEYVRGPHTPLSRVIWEVYRLAEAHLRGPEHAMHVYHAAWRVQLYIEPQVESALALAWGSARRWLGSASRG